MDVLLFLLRFLIKLWHERIERLQFQIKIGERVVGGVIEAQKAIWFKRHLSEKDAEMAGYRERVEQSMEEQSHWERYELVVCYKAKSIMSESGKTTEGGGRGDRSRL